MNENENNIYYDNNQQGTTPVQNAAPVYNIPPQPVPVTVKQKSNFFPKLMGAVALGLTFGICGALGFYAVNSVTDKLNTVVEESSEIQDIRKAIKELEKKLSGITAGVPSDSTETISTTTNQSATFVTTDVTGVVEKVMPSMVSITNLYEESINYWGRTYTQEAQASGSGIIIGEHNDEYLIVTNYHVIEDCVQLTAQFVDESEAACAVKGYDASMDIAVISVPKSALSSSTKESIKIAELGNSDVLKIGEPAIAIGNALGYGQSVTTGVISALNRKIEIENSYDALIQTSAAINPGNSGGALLNIAGQVVGINSSKIGGSTIEGMGYAIPVNAVRDLIEEFSNREILYKVDEDQRGYLGISGATVDTDTIETFGIPAGVYVTKVYERSAAEQAGICTGDVITKVNGQNVDTIAELQDYLSYCKGGDVVIVTIQRTSTNGYEEMQLEVTLSGQAVFEE